MTIIKRKEIRAFKFLDKRRRKRGRHERWTVCSGGHFLGVFFVPTGYCGDRDNSPETDDVPKDACTTLYTPAIQ